MIGLSILIEHTGVDPKICLVKVHVHAKKLLRFFFGPMDSIRFQILSKTWSDIRITQNFRYYWVYFSWGGHKSNNTIFSVFVMWFVLHRYLIFRFAFLRKNTISNFLDIHKIYRYLRIFTNIYEYFIHLV